MSTFLERAHAPLFCLHPGCVRRSVLQTRRLVPGMGMEPSLCAYHQPIRPNGCRRVLVWGTGINPVRCGQGGTWCIHCHPRTFDIDTTDLPDDPDLDVLWTIRRDARSRL